MTDVGFVIAGYAVILGGAALYAIALGRRLRAARETSMKIRRDAEAAGPPDRTA